MDVGVSFSERRWSVSKLGLLEGLSDGVPASGKGGRVAFPLERRRRVVCPSRDGLGR